jgi:hypothetical protein
LKAGGDWYELQENFDNVFNAFLTLFVIANGEGWPVNLAVWMDSVDVNQGPSYNYSDIQAIIFFILFIMIG